MTSRDEPRARAAQTKKQSTRQRLLDAAPKAMAGFGMDADVGEIAELAGVSVPTFYNFYRSRNELCREAVTELLRRAFPGEEDRDFEPTMRKLHDTLRAGANASLVRAALMGRWESPPDEVPRHLLARDRLDPVVAVEEVLGPIRGNEGRPLGDYLVLRPAALYLLEQVAEWGSFDSDELAIVLGMSNK